MKRTLTSLVAVAFVTALAISASASTSVNLVVAGPTSVAAGSVITLTAVVTSGGGETDKSVLGIVQAPGAANATLAAGSQVNLSTVGVAAPGWSSGALTCTTAFCTAFSQINPNGPQAAGVTGLVIGTMSATINGALAPGSVVTFNWRSTPTTQRVDWYGLTSGVGTSVTIIPEPTTAAMIGLGLFGLAFAG